MGAINKGQEVVNELLGGAIASAATVDLRAATGNYVHITGSVQIDALTLYQGAERTVIFDAAPLIVHGANLQLPGAANIQVEANDRAVFRGDAAGVVVCTSYVRADGTVLTVTNVQKGGTGASTFTAHGVLIGNGTNQVRSTAAGVAGQVLTSNGPNADPTYQTASQGGVMLLAPPITPTAAASVNALSVFSAAYDSYLVIIEGILPAANDFLMLRFANAGVADSGNKYYETGIGEAADSAAGVRIALSSSVAAAGRGINAAYHILNANDALGPKTITGQSVLFSGATTVVTQAKAGAYDSANAISGFQLFWDGGSNFAETGKILIYGYSNS